MPDDAPQDVEQGDENQRTLNMVKQFGGRVEVWNMLNLLYTMAIKDPMACGDRDCVGASCHHCEAEGWKTYISSSIEHSEYCPWLRAQGIRKHGLFAWDEWDEEENE